MKKSTKGAVVAFAVATMFSASDVLAGSHEGGGEKKDAKVKCTGVNECAGKGACAAEGNDCAGKNSCKGAGVLEMGADECKEKGGTVVN